MLRDLTTIVAAAAVLYVPGLALGLLLLPSRILAVGLAPLVTAGTVLLAALVSGVLGVSFGLPLVVCVAAVLVVGAVVLRRRRGGQAGEERERSQSRTGLIFGGIGVLAGIAMSIWSWGRGLGGLATLPVEHDMILHTVLVAYISRTGVAAPWMLAPTDVLSGEPTYFYPAGLHCVAALVADTGVGAVPAINALTVLLFGVCWPVGLAATAAVTMRRAEKYAEYAWYVAGTAAVVGAMMYRPAVSFAHDGGILPNAAVLVLMLPLVAALVDIPRTVMARVVVGLAAAGAVAVHPNAVPSVAIFVVVWLIAECLTANGRGALRSFVRRVWVVALVAAVLVAPVIVGGLNVAGVVRSYPSEIQAMPLSKAVSSTLGLVYGPYLDPEFALHQRVLGVLMIAGVIVAVATRTFIGAAAVWLFWVGATVALALRPSSAPIFGPLAGLYYNQWTRVFAHVSVVVPLLAAVALVGLSVAALRVVRMVVPDSSATRAGPAPLATAVSVGIVVLAFTFGSGLSYVHRNTVAVSQRYEHPEFVRVDDDDQRAFRYLSEHVEPGQRVMNSPNDGSTYMYVEYGIPVVNVSTLGFPGIPDTYELMSQFNQVGRSAYVDAAIRRLDIGWLYVDDEAPRIGAAGSPERWAPEVLDVPPGMENLPGAPILNEVFRSGSVHVYRIDPALTHDVAAPTPPS